MPTTRTTTRRVVTGAKKAARSAFSPVRSFQQFLETQSQRKILATREDKLKEELSAYVDENGYEDDRKNLWIDLPEVVVGPDGKKYDRLKRERRTQEVFNVDVAEEILKKKGLMEGCTRTLLQVTDADKAIAILQKHGLIGEGFELVTEIDADEVRKALFREQITKREYDRIFTQAISWAFTPNAGVVK